MGRLDSLQHKKHTKDNLDTSHTDTALETTFRHAYYNSHTEMIVRMTTGQKMHQQQLEKRQHEWSARKQGVCDMTTLQNPTVQQSPCAMLEHKANTNQHRLIQHRLHDVVAIVFL
jgi:hypothetical protein